MPKVPYSYEVNGKLVTGNGSLVPICSFNIKLFLIAKFDCINLKKIPTYSSKRLYSTVKLDNNEQIGIKETFPATNLPFTS